MFMHHDPNAEEESYHEELLRGLSQAKVEATGVYCPRIINLNFDREKHIPLSGI